MKNNFVARKTITIFKDNTPLSPYWFEDVCEISNNVIAYRPNLLVIFNQDGTCVLEEKVNVIDIDDLFIIVEKDGFKGVYFHDGGLIVPIKCSAIEFYSGQILTLQDGKQISYNTCGEIVPSTNFINEEGIDTY